MGYDNSTKSSDLKNSPFIQLFFGIFPIVSGVINILISVNVIPYVDTRPNTIAIFNDPHTWEVFALGATLLFFGIANILPTKMKILGRIIKYFLLISFIAVVVGVVLEKIR